MIMAYSMGQSLVTLTTSPKFFCSFCKGCKNDRFEIKGDGDEEEIDDEETDTEEEDDEGIEKDEEEDEVG